MITKLYEYVIDMRRKNIRMVLNQLNKKYTNVPVIFYVKDRIGRTFKNFKYSKIINNIDYNRHDNSFKIIFNDQDTYITINRREISFHERFENYSKCIFNEDETLRDIINLLKNL